MYSKNSNVTRNLSANFFMINLTNGEMYVIIMVETFYVPCFSIEYEYYSYILLVYNAAG